MQAPLIIPMPLFLFPFRAVLNLSLAQIFSRFAKTIYVLLALADKSNRGGWGGSEELRVKGFYAQKAILYEEHEYSKQRG